MRIILAAAFALAPQFALAAGSDDTEPPKPTETTVECAKGEVWDEKTKACIKAESSLLDNDQRFGAVRELAYAGRPDEALVMLATMTEGETPRVLTYQASSCARPAGWKRASSPMNGPLRWIAAISWRAAIMASFWSRWMRKRQPNCSLPRSAWWAAAAPGRNDRWPRPSRPE